MPVAIRDRIREKAQPLLDPGEQIQAVIPAQTKNGWLGALGIIWLIFTNRYRPIVITDRRIAITDSGKYSMAKPTTIFASLPRSTQIGPPSGIWWKCTTLGQPLYIHKRFHTRRRARRLPPPRRLITRLSRRPGPPWVDAMRDEPPMTAHPSSRSGDWRRDERYAAPGGSSLIARASCG